MNKTKHNICILGASFNTGNLGVSALGWSSIRLLLNKWPDAHIEMVGTGRVQEQNRIIIGECRLEIKSWPIRFCFNPFAENHIWKLLLSVCLIRILPFMRSLFAKQQNTLGAICRADITVDITGGDSFSDIYGMKRFLLGYLTKRLCQLTGKPFIMLPQTYGPFKGTISRQLAKRILKRTTLIYSRDKEGLTVVKSLIGETDKVTISPDVAFVLNPKAPESPMIGDRHLRSLLSDNNTTPVVGLNISGLLYNGGYTGNNQFGLKCNYRRLIESIVTHFVNFANTKILLVPHVVSEEIKFENDLIACRQIYSQLKPDIREKVFIAEPSGRNPFFDQCEIKHIIGKCEFFMGSRMHATIAAISQCIPTAGLAYSRKFSGVYESVGLDDCVVDLREMETGHILDTVTSLFGKRKEIKQRLEKNIPTAKENVFKLFENV